MDSDTIVDTTQFNTTPPAAPVEVPAVPPVESADSKDTIPPAEEDFDPLLPEDPTPTPPTGDDEEYKDVDDRVQKAIKPVQDQLFASRRDNEVNSFLSTTEGEVLKPFTEKIKRYAKHHKFAGMKIEAVAAAAVGTRQIMKLGAGRAAAKDQQAKASQTPGSSPRPKEGDMSGIPDFASMSKAEFAEHQQKVLSGQISRE